MQLEPWVLGQPCRHVGVVVGRVVVEDEMNSQTFGDLATDRLQELQKLEVPVASQALADHQAGQDVQRGEKRRYAVAGWCLRDALGSGIVMSH